MVGLRMTRRRWAIVASVSTLATAILASSVVAGQFRSPDSEAFHAGLATGEISRVADIAAGEGLPGRGVFVQTTDTGQLCLWDAPSAGSRQRQGGCNSADDPLGGHELSVSFAYDGGPAVSDVRDARLIGLVAERVAEVHVLMSDGSRRAMRLRDARIDGASYRAFGHRFTPGELRQGAEPAAVIALDAAGQEIDRQQTGFVR